MADERSVTIDIRLVEPATTGLLARIADDVFDEPAHQAALATFAAVPGHALYVAVVQVGGSAQLEVVGQVRGMVHHQPDRRPDLYIDNLGVAPAWRRRRIATRLIRALLDWGTERNCETVWVATEVENGEAQAFYDSLGLTQRQACVVLSHDLATMARAKA